MLQAVVKAAREVKAGRGPTSGMAWFSTRFSNIGPRSREFGWEPRSRVVRSESLISAEVSELRTFRIRNFSTYFPDVSWTVVEQPGLVSVGSTEFATDRLRFAASLEEAVSCRPVDVIL